MTLLNAILLVITLLDPLPKAVAVGTTATVAVAAGTALSTVPDPPTAQPAPASREPHCSIPPAPAQGSDH